MPVGWCCKSVNKARRGYVRAENNFHTQKERILGSMVSQYTFFLMLYGAARRGALQYLTDLSCLLHSDGLLSNQIQKRKHLPEVFSFLEQGTGVEPHLNPCVSMVFRFCGCFCG